MISPSELYLRKLRALFGKDPEITIMLSGTELRPVITFYITNETKTKAIQELLPHEIKFGDVTVDVEIVFADTTNTGCSVIYNAFKGNPAFKGIVHDGDRTYCLFAKEIVQFYNGSTTNLGGNWTGLYEDIADEVLNYWEDDFYFCTDDE